jgi:hypothetical protein
VGGLNSKNDFFLPTNNYQLFRIFEYQTADQMINEKLLQFIWQFQYFNKNELQTIAGENLQIIYPGISNKDQGPDFSEAKIKIDTTILAGNIELHINASDWHEHHHSSDKNYANIILHVVWNNDEIIFDNNCKPFPALDLQSRVSKLLLEKYEQLMQSQQFIPCEKSLPVLSEIGWISWKERLAIERLQRKSILVLELFKQSNHHWEEVFWWLLARNFGMKINAEIFEQLAKSISINIIAKHKNQIHQLEALLLGQSGLLENDFEEDYPKLLQREYQFLAKKYKLNILQKQPAFLRMRPANFPTVRLAQLAMLINHSTHLFSKIKEAKDIAEIKSLLNITANDYWHYHYIFDEMTPYKPKKLGVQMADNIIINTIVPVLFAYGFYTREQQWKDKAILFLNEISAEQNNITKSWQQLNVTNANALDSQALLELKKYYCDEKRCLDCAVGNKFLKEKE